MPRAIGPQALFREARENFHARLLQTVLTRNAQGIYSNADSRNASSRAVSARMAEILLSETVAERLAGQTAGNEFETLVAQFIRETFVHLRHLRPGQWHVAKANGGISRFSQYAHLTDIAAAAADNLQLAAALGNDYAIKPDVVIYRLPEPEDMINAPMLFLDDELSTRAVLRQQVSPRPILHASVSCKWTMRSDRAQNSRTEALNLIRNRKGGLPHIVTVMGEPMPSRISSVALGTGDIDCTYHFALYELQQAVLDVGSEDARDMLEILVEGGRLKDISDLPLDLAT